MKKYKVITDELGWNECAKGDVLQWDNYWDCWATSSLPHYPLFSEKEFKFLLKHHSDWLEEVKEPKRKFSRNAVVGLMRDAVSSCCAHPQTFDEVQGFFNGFLKERGFEDIMDKNSRYFLKPKQFIKEDMIEFAIIYDEARKMNFSSTSPREFKREIIEKLINEWLKSKEK